MLCAIASAACSSEHHDDPLVTAGSAGGVVDAGGMEGGSNAQQPPDAGTPIEDAASIQDAAPPEDAGAAQYEALLECVAEAPCTTASANVVENFRSEVDKPLFECVFAQLAAGTPGEYVYTARHVFSNGSGDTKHTFLVQQDGTVLYGSSKYGVVQNPSQAGVPETMVESWQRVQRCELQPPTYFEDCQAKLASDPSGNNTAWPCVYGTADFTLPDEMPWVVSCQEVDELSCP